MEEHIEEPGYRSRFEKKHHLINPNAKPVLMDVFEPADKKVNAAIKHTIKEPNYTSEQVPVDLPKEWRKEAFNK